MSKTYTDSKEALKGIKKGTAHLAILVDESGSMSPNRESVVSGVNEFINDFKKKDATITIAFFDYNPGDPRTRFHRLLKSAKTTKPLHQKDYSPRGLTPLNDAIADVIDKMAKEVEDKSKVMITIITDGLENASERSVEDVKKLIQKYEKKGWGFLYLGANQDAQYVGTAFGIQNNKGFTSSPVGTQSAASHIRSANHGYYSQGQGGLMAHTAATPNTIPEVEDEDGDK